MGTSLRMKSNANAFGAAAGSTAANKNSSSAAISQEKQRRRKPHHYVFGYGSLMCPESRSITNPNLIKREGKRIEFIRGSGCHFSLTPRFVTCLYGIALPVVIQDVERVWSARTSSGFTAMGVRFRKGAECTGVLIEVKADELADLDKREAVYNRLPIQLDNIDQVPFLEEDDFYEDDHPVFEAQDESNEEVDDQNVKVWIYMQKDPMGADASHPIPQSYVDIIIRGCLTISEDFARSFIETTHGWKDDEDHWVDDREVPIYQRADTDYSDAHGETIDKLLEDHVEDELQERVEYDPVEHLDALADALQEDKAHPRAIKHIVKRVKEAASTTEGEEAK